MPDRDVKTIRHLIYYQYAKIIAKSAFGADSKSTDYGFIKNTFRDLAESEKTWSDIIREDKQFVQSEKKCIYCGSIENLQWEHIVPKSININDRCSTCEKVQGIHNMIWSCEDCNTKKKRRKGLYHFYQELFPQERKFFDKIPALVEKKYLKTIFYCHQCNGTLDDDVLNRVGEITVLDLDCIIQ
jgi:hypothetical protein